MARAAAVGNLDCPVCDFKDGEIRPDRNGHLYFYCPDCNAQIFTRGCQVKEGGFRRKMRAIAAAVEQVAQEVKAEEKPEPEPKPEPKAAEPARKPVSVPRAKAAPPTVTVPKPEKKGLFL